MFRENWNLQGDPWSSTITIRRVVDGCLQTIKDWNHPGVKCLGLHAFIVEANLLRKQPWKMPRGMNQVVEKLQLVDVQTSDQLALRLADAKKLNDDLKQLGERAFTSEMIEIFRKLLLSPTGRS